MIIESLRLRWLVIFLVFAGAVIWTAPNFIDTEKHWWPVKGKMVLGLDIQGGSHLVLRVDVDNAVRQDSQRMSQTLQAELATEKTPVKKIEVTDGLKGAMQITLQKPEDATPVKAYIEKMYNGIFAITNENPGTINLQYAELHIREFKSRLLDQAIATIRNRIDEFGVAEPSITAQGSDRILVQLPGIKDASTAKDLINRTARLDFMIVDTTVQPVELQKWIEDAEKAGNFNLTNTKYSQYVDKLNEALKAKLPANSVLYFEKPENAASLETAKIPYLLKTNQIVTGDRLTNAQVGLGEFGKPVVHFSFDAVGTKQFGDLTTKHSRQQMAIVLDKVVKSAPSINEPITGGRGQITLGGGRDQQQSLNEAKIISTALRAGALPATLEQLEERTVGPSLGADAIRQGQIGTVIAALAVFLFMAFYYKAFGIIADLALAFNLLITVAILSSLGATLTLPGVAGLALTLGISVDASVIIFERIKEEMRHGASAWGAIREGYERAFSSILDSNITSIMVCVVLYYYGTGPVRGFAVTLLTGLVITTFTAVFFTRAIIDFLVGRLKWKLPV